MTGAGATGFGGDAEATAGWLTDAILTEPATTDGFLVKILNFPSVSLTRTSSSSSDLLLSPFGILFSAPRMGTPAARDYFFALFPKEFPGLDVKIGQVGIFFVAAFFGVSR